MTARGQEIGYTLRGFDNVHTFATRESTLTKVLTLDLPLNFIKAEPVTVTPRPPEMSMMPKFQLIFQLTR
jgi:hypothetical protein